MNYLLAFDEEEQSDYKVGGYHPVMIGDVLNNRYKVEKKLGWGHFSTVWYCNDMYVFSILVFLILIIKIFNRKEHRGVAVKIVRSSSNYTHAANEEIGLLKEITNNDPNDKFCVCHLLDTFQVHGPNGTRVILIITKKLF